jgi:O-antigen ligase
MINLKKISYTNFIIVLIIPLLISGPFFSDLLVSLSSIFFLFYVYKNKTFNYFTQTPLVIFFAFCIYCIFVSIFVASNILMSFKSSLFYFRIGVFSCLIWYLIEQDKKILNYFYNALVICFLVLMVDGYIQFFTGTNIAGLPKAGNRISSFFGDDLIMGSYLSRLFPLLIALFIAKEKKKLEIYFMFLFFILVSGLILISGERASFAFLTLSTLFVLLLTNNALKFRLCFFFGSIILILMLSLANPALKHRVFVAPFESSGLKKNEDKKYFFTAYHDSLIRTSFNMFKDKPLIGHGPKMFRVICKDEKYAVGISPCMTHPHNFYVQLLAETGIIGFSFLFSVFAYVMYCAYRQFKSMVLRQKRYLSDYQVCLLAGILITVWPITTNGNFFNNWLMIVYSLPVGFYLHSLYGKNKEEVNNN